MEIKIYKITVLQNRNNAQKKHNLLGFNVQNAKME